MYVMLSRLISAVAGRGAVPTCVIARSRTYCWATEHPRYAGRDLDDVLRMPSLGETAGVLEPATTLLHLHGLWSVDRQWQLSVE